MAGGVCRETYRPYNTINLYLYSHFFIIAKKKRGRGPKHDLHVCDWLEGGTRGRGKGVEFGWVELEEESR